MSESGYQSLYSVSQDVLEKKMQAVNDEIIQKANQKAIEAFEYTTNEVKMRRRIIEERQENMQQYVDNLAEQIVDSESEVMGKNMAERTKRNIRKLTQKKKEEKEARDKKEKIKNEENLGENDSITEDNEIESPKVQLTEEERRKKLLARKRKLKKLKEMKEREKNEEEQNG